MRKQKLQGICHEASRDVLRKVLRQKITDIALKDNALILSLRHGIKIKIFDDEQGCCEERFMTTDDTLEYFIGSDFLDAELATVSSKEDENGDLHEIQFLHIKTSNGVLTMENHNRHNGCYGGFDIRAVKIS